MKQVLLRPASAEDFDAFYAIKADANNIKWGGFDKAPQKIHLRGGINYNWNLTQKEKIFYYK